VLDLVRDESAGPDTLIATAEIRPLPPVPVDAPLDDALSLLRRTSAHLGGVVDEHGTVIGIVALEDLVEQFVGTVRDTTHRMADPGPGPRP
ncbi:MAG: CBS domain-containing protein, partial [Rhodococcus sp. (in: high G+C Gram-positive bacteria)]|nr:CBS domain-containing protein [Rhodococcus sp. (in: high G+C Gram-positive bacteria)]MDX5451447.1 CBS domain-containing protein [Rhodococcus sp. (in: high G+C Gram-positive bacteria)]